MGKAQEALAAKKQQLVDVATTGRADLIAQQEASRKKAVEILQKYDPKLSEDEGFKKAASAGFDYSQKVKDDLGSYFAQKAATTAPGISGLTTQTAPVPGSAPALTAEQEAQKARDLAEAQQAYQSSLGNAEYIRTGAWEDERRATLQKEIDALTQASSAESAQEAKDVVARQGDVARNMAAQIQQQKSILTDPAQIQALQAKGVSVGDIERMQAAQVGNVGDVEAAQVANVRDAQAAQIGNMDLATAAQIDQAKQAQFRTGQESLVAQLQQQAAGQGPSLAEAQLKTAQNRNLAQQLAIAGASRGGNAGLQARQLQQNMATSGQELANQAAQARMQEQLAARQQLQSTLAGAREQDIGLATSQAGLTQQTSLANQAAVNNQRLEQAKLNQQAELVNVQKAQEVALKNGDFQQASRLQNQQKNIQIAIQNATLQQQSNLANVESSRAKVQQQAQIETQLSLANQQSGMTAQQANQQAQIQMQEMRLKEDQFKQSRIDEYTKLGMTFEQAAQQTNLDWNKFQEQLTQQYSGMRQQASTAQAQIASQEGMNAQNIQAQKDAADKALTGQIVSGVLGAGGAVGGAAIAASDRTAKKDIKSASKDIKEFLGALEASKYKYKEPNKPGRGQGEFVSVMAQELEKTKLGKSMVGKDAEGVKNVDYGKGFGAILAAQVELNKRLAELESKTKKKGK